MSDLEITATTITETVNASDASSVYHKALGNCVLIAGLSNYENSLYKTFIACHCAGGLGIDDTKAFAKNFLPRRNDMKIIIIPGSVTEKNSQTFWGNARSWLTQKFRGCIYEYERCSTPQITREGYVYNYKEKKALKRTNNFLRE